jgi:hypothetical protein
VTTLFAACGGSQPEAKEPEPSSETASGAKEESDAPKKEASDDGDKGGDGEKGDKEDKKAEGGKSSKSSKASKDEPEEKKSGRSAKDIVTRKDVLFMFSFTASEPHQVAEKKCTEKSGDDPKKKADCMSKASKSFENDGMAFTEDADGKFWWLTVRRKGSGLQTLHKVEVDFDGDSDSKVTVKTKGPDKGTKPGGLPKELVIEVPSESEIAITDPKQGRLVYEAKLGLMGKDER